MATIPRSTQAAERHFVLHGVPWSVYETLRESEENYHVRMTYDRGTLEFMSPSTKHERAKSLLSQLLETFTVELRMPRQSFGSATWKREMKLKGLEADECYYILNHARIRDVEEINLDVDPPPDLALEVEVSRSTVKRMAIYAALGVPEIWRWRKGVVQAYSLSSDGKYEPVEMSLNLPMLRVKDLEPFLDRKLAADESQWILGFRQWVHERFGAKLGESRGSPS
jgi:Uma2 family endonuclease